MKVVNNIKQVVNAKLCIGCGLCSISDNTGGVIISHDYECKIPQNVEIPSDDLANAICPGKGYAIKENGRELFENESQYDLKLGFINSFFAARTGNESICRNASSGGIITSILLYLLEKGIVDKVCVTQFVCSKDGVETNTFLTSDKKEILNAQGSKYCPVDLSGLLNELHTTNDKVAIMATPCAIAGIRNILKENKDFIKANIKIMISNFCGGHKSFKNIKRLAEIHKMDYYNLSDFRFRGGGQPGSLKFIEKGGRFAQTPYPLYVGLNGYSKMLRCHLCVDATGELADVACGDAWIERFRNDKNPWSVVLCRNKKTTNLLKTMESEGWIITERMTIDEVKQSQHLNLTSKKIRQKTRRRLYGLLGYSLPNYYEEGYSSKNSSMKTEFLVFCKHKIKLILEVLGLYMFLYGHKKLRK